MRPRNLLVPIIVSIMLAFSACEKKAEDVDNSQNKEEPEKIRIVMEVDVKKAVDTFMGTQAKDIVRDCLGAERIACRSVDKTLERKGDYWFILRPYVVEDSGTIENIADMKRGLVDMGFDAAYIDEKPGTVPELWVRTSVELDITDLVDVLLGGNNPLIVNITIPQRFQGDARTSYIQQADRVLDELEVFDSPLRLKVEGNTAIFSIQISEDSASRLAEDKIDDVMKAVENRISKFDRSRVTVKRIEGTNRIIVETRAGQHPASKLARVKSPGILEFKLVKENPASGNLWYGAEGTTEPSPDEIPAGCEVRQHIDGDWYVLDSEALLDGTDLKSNSATIRRGEFGKSEVILYLTPEGQSKFSELTGANVGKHLAILLDNVIQSAPRITEKIQTQSASITGDFTEDEADYLAKILRAGAFPAPVKIIEARIIGPDGEKDLLEPDKASDQGK